MKDNTKAMLVVGAIGLLIVGIATLGTKENKNPPGMDYLDDEAAVRNFHHKQEETDEDFSGMIEKLKVLRAKVTEDDEYIEEQLSRTHAAKYGKLDELSIHEEIYDTAVEKNTEIISLCIEYRTLVDELSDFARRNRRNVPTFILDGLMEMYLKKARERRLSVPDEEDTTSQINYSGTNITYNTQHIHNTQHLTDARQQHLDSSTQNYVDGRQNTQQIQHNMYQQASMEVDENSTISRTGENKFHGMLMHSQQQIEALKKMNEDLQRRTALEKQEAKLNHELQLAQLKDGRDSRTALISQLRQQLGRNQQELFDMDERLKNQKAITEDALRDQQMLSNMLEEQRQRFEKQIGMETDKLKNMTKELETLHKAGDHSSQRIIQLSSEVEATKAEISKLQEQNQKEQVAGAETIAKYNTQSKARSAAIEEKLQGFKKLASNPNRVKRRGRSDSVQLTDIQEELKRGKRRRQSK